MSAPILRPEAVERIRARRALAINGLQPWLFAYRTRGGGYIIANDGKQSDSQKPRDLIYIFPGGGVVALGPLVNPELVAEVEAAVAK